MPIEVDLRAPDAYLTFTLRQEDLPLGAQPDTGSLVQRAVTVAQVTTVLFGARPSHPVEFSPLPAPPPNRAGATTIQLEQQWRGLPVFQAGQSVRFSSAGEAQGTRARLVGQESPPEVSVEVTAEAAVYNAIRHVSGADEDGAGAGDQLGPPRSAAPADGTWYQPEVLARFTHLASQPTVLKLQGVDEPVTACLVWFPLPKELRTAWDITIGLSEVEGAFRVVVDGREGDILYCVQLVPGAACQGNVFRSDPAMSRTVVPFPLEWPAYGLGTPPGLPPSPPAWVVDQQTAGYTSVARVGASGPSISGDSVDGAVIFNPADPQGVDQMVLNAFYGTCFMHDLTYLLGFREPNGSYQDGVVSATGLPSGPVKVEVRPQPIMGTAHWWPLGSIPTMRLGPKQDTRRHTALDMTIVFHEYMHGVSCRLVGGGATRTPLLEAQSSGMGEGWGDYVACTVLGTPLIGQWLANDDRGLRRFPYDEQFPTDQVNFATLSALSTYEIGSLWCAALLEMNRRIGANLGLQLVIESMKGLSANPSLLDGRDELLLTLDDLRDSGALPVSGHALAKTGIWAAFAAFGMGVGASSQGPSKFGVVADNSVP
ncbi:M36 family metallopeptidase [Streptomyces sp. NPDC060020]|uniref:M36 family metallopeptidase n=1 Tax=Streptomyces sp. NPDC060020 TaxID=3347038 RepID=UPI0036ACF099